MNKHIFFGFLLISLIILIARISLFYTHLPQHKDGEEVVLTTRIISEPQMKAKTQKFRVLLTDGTMVTVSTGVFPSWKYGDIVQVAGKLEMNTTKKGQVFYTLFYPKIISSEQDNNVLLAVLYDFRQKITTIFEKTLRPIDASLLLGIVFGIKRGMPDRFYTDLQTAGVLHIIAASGMNVTMVAGALFFLFQRIFHRRTAVLISIVGVWLFALLAGLESSIVRAAIMGSFAFSAQLLGKQYAALYTLGLTGAVMLLIDPGQLTNVGFQLSFLATLGIIVIKPLLGDKAYLDDVTTTLSALIATMPILLASFGQVNILSVVVNALVLWTIPIVSVIGGISAIIGLVFPPLANILLYTAIPFLWFFEKVVMLFGSIPISLHSEKASSYVWIGYYLLVGSLILFIRKRKTTRSKESL